MNIQNCCIINKANIKIFCRFRREENVNSVLEVMVYMCSNFLKSLQCYLNLPHARFDIDLKIHNRPITLCTCFFFFLSKTFLNTERFLEWAGTIIQLILWNPYIHELSIAWYYGINDFQSFPEFHLSLNQLIHNIIEMICLKVKCLNIIYNGSNLGKQRHEKSLFFFKHFISTVRKT